MSLTRLDQRTALNRLAAMLVRRGYGAGVAYEVAREVLTEGESCELDDD